MSSGKRKMLLDLFRSANIGCGCGKTKPTDIFEPKPMPKPSPPDHHHQKPPRFCANNSSSSSNCEKDEEYTSTTSFSFNVESSPPHCSPEHGDDPDKPKVVNPSSKLDDSIMIVKDSNDPYSDFRESMLQMILEKEIFSRDDLQELLKCFLELNSPLHHETIIKAFMEIWNGVISTPEKAIASQESHEIS